MILTAHDFGSTQIALLGWIPLVAAGIGALGSWLASRKSAEEKRALSAQSTQANNLSNLSRLLQGYAKKQYALAEPAYTKALGYYSGLAGGSTAGIGQILAPDLASLSASYAGGEKGIERMGLRGGERDMARANLNQARTASIGSMFSNARRGAMEQLASLGAGGVSGVTGLGTAAIGGYGSAGNLFSSLLSNAYNQKKDLYGSLEKFGISLAEILAPYMSGSGKKNGSSSGATLGGGWKGTQ